MSQDGDFTCLYIRPWYQSLWLNIFIVQGLWTDFNTFSVFVFTMTILEFWKSLVLIQNCILTNGMFLMLKEIMINKLNTPWQFNGFKFFGPLIRGITLAAINDKIMWLQPNMHSTAELIYYFRLLDKSI